MLKFARLVAALAVFAAAPAVAEPTDLSAFDPARAQSLADRLVLCNLSRYLGTAPDLDAQWIYVRRETRWFEPMTPRSITVGGAWYDEDLERAYLRYRVAGLVTREEMSAAQRRFGPAMERAFDQPNVREQRFLQSQASFCRALAKNAPRR